MARAVNEWREQCVAAGRRDQRSGGAGYPEAAARLLWPVVLALAVTACRPSETERRTIRFTMPADGFVSLQIKAADGRVIRKLAAAQGFPKGAQQILWDGLDDARQPTPSGEYQWSGAMHTGIRAKLRGRACADFSPPWGAAESAQQWGGDSGVPSAVAAAGERVYLGWSGARSGSAVLACDLDGRPLWSWRDTELDRRVPGGTGVKTLDVDGDVVTVLYGIEGLEVKGSYLIKLDARTGAPIPWPENRALTINQLWPSDARVKPIHADGMAARAGRIFLTFTEAQFLAVLDAQTGAYLQTVVGAPPELISVVPTKTESADQPGTLVDADFALVSLRGGVLGKVLFAHDPLWVVTSDLQPLDREERITALIVIGDGAKYHQHSAFVGLGAPFHQVQRRALLDTEGFLWSAGRAGGRQPGPWVPEALGAIRGVALDARGRLWIAEGDANPPRFSVWESTGNEGRLVREFFGPLPFQSRGTAVFPGDPNIFIGAGCEWRLDPKTGLTRCTGVITREDASLLGFERTADGRTELAIGTGDGEASVFERVGEGRYEFRRLDRDYRPALSFLEDEKRGGFRLGEATLPGLGKLRFTGQQPGVILTTEEALVLARLFEPPLEIKDGALTQDPRPVDPKLGADLTHVPIGDFPRFTQTPDGRVFAAAAALGLMNLEITGLDSIRPLPGGKLTIKEPAR